MAQYERRFYNLQKLRKSSIMHPEPEFLLEKSELANLLDLPEDHFYLTCIEGTDLLYEVQICMNFSEDGIFATEC